MARRKRQNKPKGPAPQAMASEQRAIPSNAELMSVSGDAAYFINQTGAVTLAGGGGLSEYDVAGYPPVSQCLQMIAGDCAKLPLRVKLRQTNGLDFVDASAEHYAQGLIDTWGRPNDEDTQFDLFYDWYFDALLWGGGYLWIQRVGAVPVALYRLLPDRTFKLDRGGRCYFVTSVYDDARGEYVKRVLPNEDVLYLENTAVGFENCKPVQLYRKTFKAAIAAVDWTARYFGQGTQSGGILMVPPGASETAINNAEKMIRERANPDFWFRTMVLKDNFRWQSTTADLKNANSAELDEQSARSVSRIYNIPPSKLGIRDSMSYNSREADKQEYLDSCLSSWLIQGRSQCHRKLILPSEQRSTIVDYVVDELAMLNMDARSTLVNNAIDRDWMDVDEARRIMKLPPRPKAEGNPTETGTGAAADVQGQALNGAQVTSMVEICSQVVAGNLPKASAKAMIAAAFPLLTETAVSAIIDPIEVKQVNGTPVLNRG